MLMIALAFVTVSVTAPANALGINVRQAQLAGAPSEVCRDAQPTKIEITVQKVCGKKINGKFALCPLVEAILPSQQSSAFPQIDAAFALLPVRSLPASLRDRLFRPPQV